MLTGWQEIEQHVKKSRKILKPLVEDAGFPIDYIGRTPFTTPELIDEWAENRIRAKQAKSCQ